MPWFYLAIALGVSLGSVSWLSGWSIALGLMIILLYHWRHLQQLDMWLNNHDRQAELPEVQGVWGRVFDRITQLQKQHQKSEQALTNTIIRIQKSANALREGVVTIDSNGALEWWNISARKMLGLKKKQDFGAPLTNLLREPGFFSYYHQADYSHPVTVYSPVNAEQVLQISVTEFGKGDKLLVLRDVTENQKLENMRSDFIGNVSHELRTPLTVIHGYLETIQSHHPALDAGLQKAHQRMLAQAQRMTNLVQDLLILSRLETNLNQPQMVANDMGQLCKQVRADARTAAQQLHKQLTINLYLHSRKCLSGVASEIRSALTNLVINAVKYTPDGGQIDMTWRETEIGLCFTVADNGIGIGQEHLQRLTERFYRVDTSRSSASGGTGLGLAIVKHVMVRHRGSLDIVSQIGHGSSFTCVFPYHQRPSNSVNDTVCSRLEQVSVITTKPYTLL